MLSFLFNRNWQRKSTSAELSLLTAKITCAIGRKTHIFSREVHSEESKEIFEFHKHDETVIFLCGYTSNLSFSGSIRVQPGRIIIQRVSRVLHILPAFHSRHHVFRIIPNYGVKCD